MRERERDAASGVRTARKTKPTTKKTKKRNRHNQTDLWSLVLGPVELHREGGKERVNPPPTKETHQRERQENGRIMKGAGCMKGGRGKEGKR